MKDLSPNALLWWWSLPEKQQLEIEISCLEEGVDLRDIIYLLSGQVFTDLQATDLQTRE
jgi:hypothetical protein